MTELRLVAGGCDPRRPVNYDDPFEVSVYFQLGPKMVMNRSFCEDVWSALTNVTWVGDARHGHARVGYTFRAAGDVIAAILDDGDYLDWTLGRPGVVSDEIAKLMRKSGWTPEVDP